MWGNMVFKLIHFFVVGSLGPAWSGFSSRTMLWGSLHYNYYCCGSLEWTWSLFVDLEFRKRDMDWSRSAFKTTILRIAGSGGSRACSASLGIEAVGGIADVERSRRAGHKTNQRRLTVRMLKNRFAGAARRSPLKLVKDAFSLERRVDKR
jgi:hypothetical protein